MMSESEKGEHEINKKRFDQYWNEDDDHPEKPDSETIYKKLTAELFPTVQPKVIKTKQLSKWIAYAAIFFLILTGGIGFNNFRIKNSSANHESVTVITAKGENKTIDLPDNTRIKLYENSQISYPASFNNNLKRQVELKGNALFTVVHDESKPFVVMAGDLVIKDIGTIFTVNTRYKDNKSFIVKVDQGSVSIENKHTASNTVTLVKGDEARYTDSGQIIVNKGSFIDTGNNKLVEFNNATINEVLDKLSTTYAVKLRLASPPVINKTYTGKFENESLDQVLDMIGFTLNFKHELKDNTILISFYKNEK